MQGWLTKPALNQRSIDRPVGARDEISAPLSDDRWNSPSEDNIRICCHHSFTDIWVDLIGCLSEDPAEFSSVQTALAAASPA